MPRRLAAILAADIVGYSRMMGADESAALAALRRLRSDVFGPKVAEAGGRIVKSMGDGWLVEFASAADAVACALSVQDALEGDAAILLRIGVHLGDVTEIDEDVFGDGVNVAARLEAFAPPGGVAISDAVRSILDGTLRPAFTDAGSQEFKNIADPLRVWTAGARINAAVGGLAARSTAGETDHKLSLMVSAFTASADDATARALADGIADDLSTDFGRFRWLAIVAPESARSPGARYVVDGVVRGSGARLRITASLTYAPEGKRLWSERWDRGADDVFALQDEIAAKIIAGVVGEIDLNEIELARAKPAATLSVRELSYLAQTNDMSERSLDEVDDLIERALAKNPDDVQANVQKAINCFRKAMSGVWPALEVAAEGRDAARRAIRLDPRTANAHSLLSFAYAVLGETERAIESAERARVLNPNGWGSYMALTVVEICAREGRPLDAASIIENSQMVARLAPNHPLLLWQKTIETIGLFIRAEEAGEDLAEVAVAFDRIGTDDSYASWWPGVFGAIVALRRAREDEARSVLAEAQRVLPDLTYSRLHELFGETELWARWRAEFERMPSLGLPEAPPAG